MKNKEYTNLWHEEVQWYEESRAKTDQDTLALIKYIADEDKLEKILENPSVIKNTSC